MWHRYDTKPTKYGDILFRSALEAKVAEQLDHLGVTWQYETPVAGIQWYLPDFTVLDAPEHLEMPRWVEVKPAELLYAVRDHLGLVERFEGIHKSDIDAAQMHEAQLSEVWKPKRLAEVTSEDVLVVSAINRNRLLSILMLPDRVELSRSHPAVCHRQVLIDREREQEDARRQAEYERRQAERAEEDRRQRQNLIDYVRANGRPARWAGWCVLCSQNQPAGVLLIFQYDNGRWGALCRTHCEQHDE